MIKKKLRNSIVFTKSEQFSEIRSKKYEEKQVNTNNDLNYKFECVK